MSVDVKQRFASGTAVRCIEHVGNDRVIPGSEVFPSEVGIVVTTRKNGDRAILGTLCVGPRLRREVLLRHVRRARAPADPRCRATRTTC